MKTQITGFGCVCSLGDNISEIRQNLFKPVSEISFLDRFESSFAGDYPVFQVSQKILSQKDETESYSFLFLKTALDEALKNADLRPEDLKGARVGAVIGTSVDASFNCFDFYKEWRAGETVSSLDPFNKYVHYSAAKEVLNYLGAADGISQTVVTACAAGTDAAGIAAEWIENSICDVVIAGGTDELNLIPFTGFIKLMIASKERSRPFDENRNGINLGEGAGVLIMESAEFAAGRNAKKAGFVLGYGNICDGYHQTSPEPSGKGMKKAVEIALNQSGLKTGDIAFVNAHATGTEDNDSAESAALNEVLNGVPVTATKSKTGHALGAAGAIEACLTLICLNEQKIPAAENFQTADKKLNLIPVLKDTKITGGKAAVSDSLGFGGCNAALVLAGREYDPA
ncbi:MAG: beta-ketoacyl-[acyl-carrier-protein] synthase family protein [Endomicrobium sp.]|jgi:3-oxoacyl-[acyl-carrier-protein] synthase-1/3-oxoacyl-[acyl-carrier-protein] synthase II|nr:beta-ketoacyl-[acyl-carrier-protein] synthase family protein [Endomicrobium sp.]